MAGFERQLFKHRGKHNDALGDIVIYPKKFSFEFLDSSCQNFQVVWTSIESIQYAKGEKSSVRLTLSAQFGDDRAARVFHLVGEDLLRVRMDFEEMKEIITRLRSSTAGTKPGSANPERSLPHLYNDVPLPDMMQSLLLQDKSLAAMFKELVQVEKILTPEEFFAIHLPSAHASSFSGTRGSATTMFADIKVIERRGKRHVEFTTAAKEQIFAMLPAVRKAFDDNVPLEMSEDEFWDMYFKSDFYTSCFSGSGRSEGGHKTDDLFGRYDNSLPRDHTLAAHIKRRKLSGLVNPDIDLTATEGDYHAPENLFHDDKQRGLESANVLVYKFNRHSEIVMGRHNQLEKVQTEADHVMSELQVIEDGIEKSFIPLMLSDSSSAGGSSSVFSAHSDTAGPFGVARHGLRHGHIAQKCYSKEEIKGSIASIIPHSDFAIRVLHSDRIHIQKSALSDQGSAHLLSPSFREQIENDFKEICTLLRYAYAALNRVGADRPKAGSPAAFKVESLIQRLESKEAYLVAKKKHFLELQSDGDEKAAAAMTIITEQLSLIHRVKAKWKLYCSRSL